MTTLQVTRAVRLPDPLRLARHEKAPELGPRILFFSGGTALRETSRRLIRYTHNSIHLITPFDSGGSSAKLRRAFRMLAVGDLRNRLMALADQTVRGQPEIFDLFAYRYPEDETQEALRERLHRMVVGQDRRIRAVPDPMRKIIRSYLRFFEERMPPSFDLRGANVGNLILCGGYLSQNRHIDPVIFLFSRLVEVRGVVRPTTSAPLHLAAELEDGSVVVGQHRLTGKEVPPLPSPIRRLFLTRRLREPEPAVPELRAKVEALMERADLICYPMGSFYTSLLPNLMVRGVGRAVARRSVPKVYIPNTGQDPEMRGLRLPEAVRTLVNTLRESGGDQASTSELLGYVLVDEDSETLTSSDLEQVRAQGVEVIRARLCTARSAPLVDAQNLVELLVSLA